jgi:hypothetical protein
VRPHPDGAELRLAGEVDLALVTVRGEPARAGVLGGLGEPAQRRIAQQAPGACWPWSLTATTKASEVVFRGSSAAVTNAFLGNVPDRPGEKASFRSDHARITSGQHVICPADQPWSTTQVSQKSLQFASI